jgi:nitroreductase
MADDANGDPVPDTYEKVETDFWEMAYTSPSLRKYKDAPVPDELIHKMLDAAIRAPSRLNRENWYFAVVRDPAKKAAVAEVVTRNWRAEMEAAYKLLPELPVDEEDRQRLIRIVDASWYLAEHLAETPALIFPGLMVPPNEVSYPAYDPAKAKMYTPLLGAGIYPAVQTMILAARSFGLGTCLITAAVIDDEELKALLKLPPEAKNMTMVTVGWPRGKFKPVRRTPVASVAFLDEFGTPFDVSNRAAG